MNVEPSVTTESKSEFRFQAAKAPRTMPTTKDSSVVTPTSTSVHGSALAITSVTGVGKYV